MFCVSCKKQIPDDAVFCQWCGKKQTKNSSTYRRRGNGLGSVYRHSSGSWTAEITLGYVTENGKLKRRKSRKYGFRTKKEAVLYLEQLHPDKEIKSFTFSELWEMSEADRLRLSQSKQTAYNIAWTKIKKNLDYRYIDDVSVQELQTIADVAETYYTRKDIKDLLSKLYKTALKNDAIDKNRAELIELPPKSHTEREIFTADEIALLWSEYAKDKDYLLGSMLIMLYTGMRPAEIIRAKVENIHLEEHYMTGGVKTEKGKNRKIVIPDKVVPIFQDMISKSKNGKLYPNKSRNDIAMKWKGKRVALGLRECLVPYCCRHTYITNLTALNISPAMLQELVGHEDYETTLNYTHLSLQERLDAVNRL